MVRVLVVDDEHDFADLLAERLRTRGMETHTAYSGREALQMVRTIAPEVVVLDITMPGMSGLETLHAVRAEKPSPEVILLTADSTLNTAVAGMKGGARDYLTKPMDIDTLVAAIGEAEGRHMEALSRQRMAQTAKLAALGELAAGVAHEINNPLQVVLNEIGWIEELVMEAQVDADRLQEIMNSLELLRGQAARCKGITSKLLTLRCTLDRQGAATTLPELVQTVLDARMSRLQALEVRVEESWSPELAQARVCASEWEQVLTNIIDNALDAMEATRTTDEAAAGQMILGLRGGLIESNLEMSIRDSGCGIESHLLTRIFEPFFSTKEVGKGIGLGLAICHGIIEAMGGSITVRSTPGHGSTFTVSAPMALNSHKKYNRPDDPASAKEE
jgi:signal transduction histidine kinase